MNETAIAETEVEKEPEIVVETAPEVVDAPEKVETADEGIDDLKRQLEAAKKDRDDDRRARVEAEKRAFDAENTARRASGDVDETNLQLVTSALARVAQEIGIHKANYRTALASGDHETAANAQFAMAELAAQKLQFEQGKTSLEQHIKEKQNAPPPVQHADPVERFASQLTPRSADWVRAHPECVRDARLNRRMIRAHEDAVDENIPSDSDAYFAFIEGRLGMGSEVTRRNEVTDESPLSDAASPTARRSPPPAAPVTRSGTPNGQRPGVIRLTKDEREMAEMMGMSETDYHKNKVALQKEGKLH